MDAYRYDFINPLEGATVGTGAFSGRKASKKSQDAHISNAKGDGCPDLPKGAMGVLTFP
jgi:hypothetical protein